MEELGLESENPSSERSSGTVGSEGLRCGEGVLLWGTQASSVGVVLLE